VIDRCSAGRVGRPCRYVRAKLPADGAQIEQAVHAAFSANGRLGWPRVFGRGARTELEVCSGTGEWIAAR
jgi:NADH:ubiquinone oxidoreductase subunit F (NADH-binding)